jgi:hypothetical protein
MITELLKGLKGNIVGGKATTTVGAVLLASGILIYFSHLFIETKNPIDTNIVWAMIGIGVYCIVTKKLGIPDGNTNK